MLPQDTIASLAKVSQNARKSRTALRHFSLRHFSQCHFSQCHFSQRFTQFTPDDGCAIQGAWVALEMADGYTVKGRKIGLTSSAMRQASQIDGDDIVLAGSFTRPTAAQAADDFHVDCGPLGSIPLRFV